MKRLLIALFVLTLVSPCFAGDHVFIEGSTGGIAEVTSGRLGVNTGQTLLETKAASAGVLYVRESGPLSAIGSDIFYNVTITAASSNTAYVYLSSVSIYGSRGIEITMGGTLTFDVLDFSTVYLWCQKMSPQASNSVTYIGLK